MNNTELMLEINRLSIMEELQKENKMLNNKLEKIKQIVKEHDNDSMPEDYWYIDRIREVLERE